VYTDAVLDVWRTYPQDLGGISNTDNLYFGQRGNGISSTDYDGLLDDIMIFDRALTACEIEEIYAAGAAGICQGDTDGDDWADYEDNCPLQENDQTDSDLDGVGDECDCAALNPSHSVVPPEVCTLILDRDEASHETARLSWSSVSSISGDGTRYDILRGFIDELPVGIGGSEECVHDDLDATETDDDFEPLPGQGVWYLVRAVSLCGQGSWGFTSSEFERISPACP
ncbi:MAG: hypothetical protein R3344_15425, partial [Acidobacteriota bacterium]|nr:hypothetical protein [Acidobacteriota bacterium]